MKWYIINEIYKRYINIHWFIHSFIYISFFLYWNPLNPKNRSHPPTHTPPLSLPPGMLYPTSACLLLVLCWPLASGNSQEQKQTFATMPSHQTAVAGSTVVLPCRVLNFHGLVQWTKDGFGLGTTRELEGFSRWGSGSRVLVLAGVEVVLFLRVCFLDFLCV